MTTFDPLTTDFPPAQRAALEHEFALDQGWDDHEPSFGYGTHDLQDAEFDGLLSWRIETGERITDAGRAKVVELAHADALAEDQRRASDVTAVFPAVGDLAAYVGRHRLSEPDTEFLDTFPEAAVEHTVELAAIAVEVSPVRRFGQWFVRNLTGTRVTVLAAAGGVLVGTGIGWWWL